RGSSPADRFDRFDNRREIQTGGTGETGCADLAINEEMKRGESAEALVRQNQKYDAPREWNVSPLPTAFVWNSGEQWLDELKKPDGIQAAFGVDPPQIG